MTSGVTSCYARFSRRSVFILLFIAILAFGGGLLSAPYLAGLFQTPTIPQTAPLLEGEAVVTAYGETLTQVYEQVLPSVVRIEVTGKTAPTLVEPDPGSTPAPVSPRSVSLSKGQGSGFVWDKSGHILTNLHVVQETEHIEVIFAVGTRAEARVVGSDPSTDLALLKVDLPPDQLVPVSLGDSASLKVGQLALAIGAPFGQEFTMTSGIISAVGRTMKSCDSCYPIAEAIQTDTPINPGNSGGPLLNERGEVIGINTWIISRSGGSAGISFALSSKAMEQIVPALMSH